MGEFLDVIKRGFQETPPAVQGQIPQGYTLDSYNDAVKLGLFDNGAPPDEVLEMMRQNGTVGKMDGLQYSDGTSDIDRIRSGINERVGEMNNFNGGEFQDIFPRYQNNFQFTDGQPSNFRVRKDPDGYRSDAAMNYPDGDIVNHSKPDVARMNMYGNGDFMNTDGLINPGKFNGGQPEYIMGNEFPNDDYIMDPMLKIRKAIEDGKLGASENADGQLAGRRDWYENKPTNTNEIYLDQPDNWDEYSDPLEDNWDSWYNSKDKATQNKLHDAFKKLNKD
tara:strand:+ start:273 stop:1106 length:834 start_codon:yes stop_codon:yes gene_type:complete